MGAIQGSEEDAIDSLVARGVLTTPQKREIERLGATWDAGPIEVALAKGYAPAGDVARALAEASGLELFDGLDAPIDIRLVPRSELSRFVCGQFVPWHNRAGVPVFVVVNPYTAQFAIRAWLGEDAAFAMVVTTAAVVTDGLLEACGHTVVEEAVYGLPDAMPCLSARRGIPWSQSLALATLAGLIVLAFAHAPILSYTVASVVAGTFFIATMLFRLILMIASLVPTRSNAPAAPRKTFPAFTILVALRDEAALVSQIAEALGAMDYPATKLDILFLLEEDDRGTRAACHRLALDGRFRVLTIPDRLPRTKPKACNFGLAFARGDFVVLYDAEDRPDPAQLKSALDALDADPDAQCVQARLGFYNASENWLTKQFAIEFSLWFCFLLPGLARLRLPVPLGGTSNHFRRKTLEAVHGWDAFNVTEDADIGIRIARSGGRVGMIDSDTAEEANCVLGNWLHQRSRWIKGYMQTWLVHMRAPTRLFSDLGFWGFWSFQLLVGGAVASAFLHLAFWAALIIEVLRSGAAAASWSGALLAWTLGVLIAGNGIAIGTGLVAAFHPQLKCQGRLSIALSALSMPLYWFLISFAAIKALISFSTRPFYWAKTRHGISRLTRRLIGLT